MIPMADAVMDCEDRLVVCRLVWRGLRECKRQGILGSGIQGGKSNVVVAPCGAATALGGVLPVGSVDEGALREKSVCGILVRWGNEVATALCISFAETRT